MHPLLKRQLRRYAPGETPEGLEKFLSAVSDAYEHMDEDRGMLERTLDLASAELTERNRELLRSNAELGKFAYVVSHDIQEPLRSIAGYVQLFARRYKDTVDDKGQQFLDGAVGGVRRMQSFITELLEYSRAGHSLRDEDIDLDELLAAVRVDLGRAIEEADADLFIDGMPSVRGDARAFNQIFMNLIGNAIKFRADDRKPTIRVSVREHPRHHEFSVVDNGSGIPAGQGQRIFELFQSAHSREKYSGTGMGLSICAKLAECMGGRLWAEDSQAEGAEFILRVPKTQEEGQR